MKKITASAFLILNSCLSFSQEQIPGSGEKGGEYPILKNGADHPCITPEQYVIMKKQIADNCERLGIQNGDQKGMMITPLEWPLRTANGLNDCSYYVIVNYVDQDPTAGIKDYNCGSSTYNGHNGDDILTYPFTFYKMDNDQVEVIASAPGTIIAKVDGNFDKNCAQNNLNYNYIAVQHADGSQALYIHLKKNSLTAKTIGQTVTTGEYLGQVGSSGNSTSPHLHFEILNPTLYEPYSGPCNVLNPTSWWANQKPYTEPAVVRVQVNKIAPVYPGCPGTETPNDDSCFTSPGTADFYIFIRNETIGLIGNMRIVNPNGSTFSSWTHNSVNNYFGSSWYWTRTLPTIQGTYTYEAVYNGDTCRKTFKINCVPTGLDPGAGLGKVDVFPNPCDDLIHITGSDMTNGSYDCTIKNILGQELLSDHFEIENGSLQKDLTIRTLPDGIYFLAIGNGENETVRKIVKRHQ